jgi:hypothetical protein
MTSLCTRKTFSLNRLIIGLPHGANQFTGTLATKRQVKLCGSQVQSTNIN